MHFYLKLGMTNEGLLETVIFCNFEEEAQPVLTDVLLQPSTAVAIYCSHLMQCVPFSHNVKIRETDNCSFTIPSGSTIYSGNQRRLDVLVDLQETPCNKCMVSKHYKDERGNGF